MSRAAAILGVVLAVVVAGVALGLLWGARDDVDPAAARRDEAIDVRVSFDPPVHAFGDPVTAEVTVDVDAVAIDPESVDVAERFRPYEVAGPVERTRTDAGPTSRIVFRYPLVCLREGCAPLANGRRTMEFELSSVFYRFRERPGRNAEILDWPSFEVVGRVDDEAIQALAWRADETALPAPTLRWSPTALASVLLVLALALAALGGWLAWRLGLRRPPEPLAAEDADVAVATPLERALAAARESLRNGDPAEPRRALERAARELGVLGFADLADRARTLAWAPGSPSPAAVDELARDAGARA